METRLTRYGKTIGFIAEGRGSDNEKRILDASRRTLGFINDRGTFDTCRRRLADQPDASIILDQ